MSAGPSTATLEGHQPGGLIGARARGGRRHVRPAGKTRLSVGLWFRRFGDSATRRNQIRVSSRSASSSRKQSEAQSSVGMSGDSCSGGLVPPAGRRGATQPVASDIPGRVQYVCAICGTLCRDSRAFLGATGGHLCSTGGAGGPLRQKPHSQIPQPAGSIWCFKIPRKLAQQLPGAGHLAARGARAEPELVCARATGCRSPHSCV